MDKKYKISAKRELDTEIGITKVTIDSNYISDIKGEQYTPCVSIYVNQNPNCNCQTASLCYMNNVLQCTGFEMSLLGEIVNIYKKKQLLIDIENKYIEKIKELFPKPYIILEKVYTSTNGSIMCIILLDVRHLLPL